MTEWIAALVEWIESTIVGLGYPGIALVMFLETVFPPIPSELVMPFAGFVAATGQLSLAGVIIAGTLGALAGALVFYALGSRLTPERIGGFLRRFGVYLGVSEEDLIKTLTYFRSHGPAAVFFGRLVSLVRSLISIPAGMSNMPMQRFLFFSALGTGLWNLLLATAGYLLGDNWERVLEWLAVWEDVVLAVVVLAGVIVVVRFVRNKRRATKNPSS